MDSWIALFEEQRKHITGHSITPIRPQLSAPLCSDALCCLGSCSLASTLRTVFYSWWRLQPRLTRAGLASTLTVSRGVGIALVGSRPGDRHVSQRMCALLRERVCSGEASGIPGPLPVIRGGQSPCAGVGLKSKQGTHTRARIHTLRWRLVRRPRCGDVAGEEKAVCLYMEGHGGAKTQVR